jgi:hypothetical protein
MSHKSKTPPAPLPLPLPTLATLVSIVLSEKTGETHSVSAGWLARAVKLGLSDAPSIAKADKSVKLATLTTEMQNDSADYQSAQSVKALLATRRSLRNASATRRERIASKLADKREIAYQDPPASKAPDAPTVETLAQTITTVLARAGFAIPSEAPEQGSEAPASNPSNPS